MFGIEGIENLGEGETPGEQAEPADVTSPPVSTPPHEAEAQSSPPVENVPSGMRESEATPVPQDDLAPDADEPGDDVADELKPLETPSSDIVPDETDQEEVQPGETITEDHFGE